MTNWRKRISFSKTLNGTLNLLYFDNIMSRHYIRSFIQCVYYYFKPFLRNDNRQSCMALKGELRVHNVTKPSGEQISKTSRLQCFPDRIS